ncbi:uncharacterized protein LTHEOB_8274 [Lasiodiplodia theobromae]|uniref:uncharacterized protein n=1 Tax=Lasiodiplodia theobromae TaxID=45133 RepID=UPI0015C40660|nr:uncharacterized protein LTHEOB_8274 [Lasiodiplodia theobromae]KAF4541693.1 hypothetical protein LTHEOB_8274 [Lasiodiplodia theobromae]
MFSRMPSGGSTLSKTKRKLSAIAKRITVSNRNAPCYFLQLPRELRDRIYELAILACSDLEDVADKPSITERPLYSTLMAGLYPRLPKRSLLTRLHLRREPSPQRELRALFKVNRVGSPANLLLTNHQISAEFAEEMYRSCKLVGDISTDGQIDRASAEIVIAERISLLLGIPLRGDFYSSSNKYATLALQRVRNWEVQIDLLPLASTTLEPGPILQWASGKLDILAGQLDRVLGLMPDCRELTLRMMLRTEETLPFLYLMGRRDRFGLVALFEDFFQMKLRNNSSVKTFRKMLTVGFGEEVGFSAEAQIFPLRERVEKWHHGKQEMKVVSDEKRDYAYTDFYSNSIDHSYYWVQEQFQPYEQFGRPGSYQSIVAATKYGYDKWVKMGKPKWNETAEHKEVMRLWRTL